MVLELGVNDGVLYVADSVNINDAAALVGVEYPTEIDFMDWANTGDQLVLIARTPPGWPARGDIWVVDLVPPYNLLQLTGEGTEAPYPDQTVTRPTWSPDDSQIAFVVGATGRGKDAKPGGICMVDSGGGVSSMILPGDARSLDWYRFAGP